jgi:hypothetical protein
VLPAATVTTLTPPSTVAVTQATGTNLHTVVDSGTITTVSAVTAITNALPVGSNTIGNVGLVAGSAKVGVFTTDQTTHGTTDLVAADITKVGGTALALGQALASASIPVVLPAATVTTLTPPSTVAVTQATGTNLHAVVDAGAAIMGKVGIDQTTPGTTNGVAVLTQVGAANLTNSQVTCDTTVGGVTIASFRATRRSITIINIGTTPVYIGSGTVSASNGGFLPGVSGASITLNVTSAVKGITATGSQVVSVLEEYD